MPNRPHLPATRLPDGTTLQDLILAPPDAGPRCIAGPVGAGKTEALVARAAALIAAGVPGQAILVLLPDREAVSRFAARLAPRLGASQDAPRCRTYYGLAQSALRDHWAELALPAGFSASAAAAPPRLLTYETAQALMLSIARPRLALGQFDGLAIRPQRLVSQLLDGLNRAATSGFTLDAVDIRLAAAWPGEAARLRHYAQAAACMRDFRSRCLERGAVDVSLAVEIFHREVVGQPGLRLATLGQVEQLLVDNLEESVPVAQSLVGDLARQARGAIVVRDADAGHRIFLGADPLGAAQLCATLGPTLELPRRQAAPDPSGALAALALVELRRDQAAPDAARLGVASADERDAGADPIDSKAKAALLGAVDAPDRRAMIEAAAEAVASELAGGLDPAQVAIVAPYVDGVLAFALEAALARRGIRLRPHRRHLPLRESPWARAGLSLAALVEPGIGAAEPFALAEALATLLPAVDPVRAARLVQALYVSESGQLAAANRLDMRDQARIGPAAIEAFEGLRTWLEDARLRRVDADPALPAVGRSMPTAGLDRLLQSLFETLSTWRPPAAGEAAAFSGLIDAAAVFRAAAPILEQEPGGWAADFIHLVQQGLVSVRAPDSNDDDRDAVLLAPAQTYLVEDHRHAVQLWLDAASPDWWTPPYQPLTNAWVLSPRWPVGQVWTRAIDREQRDLVLARLVAGLARRADRGVWVFASSSESGDLPLEGPLWRMMRDLAGDRLRIVSAAPESGA